MQGEWQMFLCLFARCDVFVFPLRLMKIVVQMHHRNGRTVFVSVRVTKVKDLSGKTFYEAVLKGKKGKEFKGLAIKGQKLR
jgi:hypothetical protein